MVMNLPALLVGGALVAGLVLMPWRVWQGLTGRLVDPRARGTPLPVGVGLAFALALLAWLAVLWGAWHVRLRQDCQGDTCLGYALPGVSFPFLYAWAEWRLWRARLRHRHPAPPPDASPHPRPPTP